MTTHGKSFQSVHPLLIAGLVSGLATLVSYSAPLDHAGDLVGLVFLAGTYWGCLRPAEPRPPEHYGLQLGGLLSTAPLRGRTIFVEAVRAFGIATLVACVILPPFFFGYLAFYDPHRSFSFQRAFGTDTGAILPFANLCLAHLLVVALPEEAFFRGYLQTALCDRWPYARRILGQNFSLALLVSSLIFAVGHVTTTPDVGRLAVFFPSLLFGLLRDRTGGIGASVVLHAECNIFSAVLGRGYGLY